MKDKTTTEIHLTEVGESITLEMDFPLTVIWKHLNKLGDSRETKSRYNNLASYYESYRRKTIPVNEIKYLKSDRSYCLFYLCDGSHILKCKSKGHFLEQHYAETSLVRIHRTYAINMDCIKRITSMNVLLEDDICLPRGRTFKDELKKRIL
ncbi:hypothetical protein FACS189432_01930 [Bacteroidia bacterium]|nr:hypothetical protein FACS189432_01930 [Bacteroidia bacterium]GHV71835.1 hypothetical protein FACS189420_8120 [Bacteroidia bacterium]